MAASKKDFFYYFKENLKATPGISHLPDGIPESLGLTSGAVFTSLTAMAGYSIQYGGQATVKEMILTLPGALKYVGAAGGVSTAVAAGAPIFVELSITASGLVAAYFLGACVGSAMVALSKQELDRWHGQPWRRMQDRPITGGFWSRYQRPEEFTITEASNFLKMKCKTRMPSEVQKAYHKYPELLKEHLPPLEQRK